MGTCWGKNTFDLRIPAYLDGLQCILKSTSIYQASPVFQTDARDPNTIHKCHFFLFLMWCVYMNTCGVCVCLCICICVWMQAHTTMPVDVRGQVQMLVFVFHIVWISYAVHCWVHPDDRQWASRDVPIWAFHLSVRVPRLQISATMFKFYMDSGDLNSVPHIYRLYLWVALLASDMKKKFRD